MSNKHFAIPTDQQGISLVTDGDKTSDATYLRGILADCTPDGNTTDRNAQTLASMLGVDVGYGDGTGTPFGAPVQHIGSDPSSWPLA